MSNMPEFDIYNATWGKGDVFWSSGPVGVNPHAGDQEQNDFPGLRRVNRAFVQRRTWANVLEIIPRKDRSAGACHRRDWRGPWGTEYVPGHVRRIPSFETMLGFEEELGEPEEFTTDRIIEQLKLGSESDTSISPGWQEPTLGSLIPPIQLHLP